MYKHIKLRRRYWLWRQSLPPEHLWQWLLRRMCNYQHPISMFNFIVPFIKLFLEMKLSSTLQITSIIAFPIPIIFILCFFGFNRFLYVHVSAAQGRQHVENIGFGPDGGCPLRLFGQKYCFLCASIGLTD